MKITTEHPSSSYGLPVILDDRGHPLDYGPGVRAVRDRLGMSVANLGLACGYSGRTIESWEQGIRPVPASALNVMAELILSRATAD